MAYILLPIQWRFWGQMGWAVMRVRCASGSRHIAIFMSLIHVIANVHTAVSRSVEIL